MRRARLLVFGVLIVGSICILNAMRWKSEPSFRGRSLSSWLRQATEPARHTNKVVEARGAIRTIGAEKSLPVLLRLATADQPQRTVHDLLLDVARAFNFNVGPVYQSDDPGEMAVVGFQAFGTNAASAVPALTVISKEPKHATVALQCLASIGPPARAVFCAALTNSDPKIRCLVVTTLTDVVTNDAEALDMVQRRLADTDAEVRSTAIQVIGAKLRTQPASLPLLTQVVARGHPGDAAVAATEIGNFETNGIAAFETLSNAAYQSPHSQAALASLHSMLRLSPERTLPILTRRLHSIDPQLRNQALLLLIREYPNPQDTIPAIEYAAQDPEEIIAIRAERFLETIKSQSRAVPTQN